jgi:hypothetical protein
MLLRRLRGLTGTALLWAVVWLPIGLVIGVIRAATLPPVDVGGAPPHPLGFLLKVIAVVTLAWTTWGAISGFVFGLLLTVTERQRDVDGLSVRRTAIWGSLGAMALPATILGLFLLQAPSFDLITPALWTLAVSAALGAGCAVGTLALAKRGRQQLSGFDADRSSLTSA